MFDTTLEIVSFVFSWLATIITIACYLPQTIKTMITKHTYSLSKWFFILGFLCSLAWIIGGIISIFVYLDQNSSMSDALLLSLPVIFTNVIGLISNLIVLIIKINNIKKAKKNNLTEEQFCTKFYNKKHSKIIDKL